MEGVSGLKKAKFFELDADFQEKPQGKVVEVQFNPETLKVNFANQLNQSAKGEAGAKQASDQSNKASQQFVGTGNTKLSLQLWFDVNAPQGPGKGAGDVRDLTKEIAYFITPPKDGAPPAIPPAVRFHWGSFHFDGVMESLEESLEFFSEDGVPLRASVTVSISQQRIVEFSGSGQAATPPGMSAAGSSPLVRAEAGATLQGMADRLGKGENWQAIASANNIENPRLVAPGQLINFNLKRG
jgi:hypothetical protein